MKLFAIIDNQNQPITLCTVGNSTPLAIFTEYLDAAKVLVKIDMDNLKIVEVEISQI